MNEDDIIKERVTISDVNYKRLLKLASSVGPHDKAGAGAEAGRAATWGSIGGELASFEALLVKLQLQLDTSSKELASYGDQKHAADSQINELNLRTEELLTELSEAEVERHQKQECNNFVDSMLKPKKVVVDGVPIIAQLNSSREDDANLCASLEEEIEELETERAKLQEQWMLRRDKYDELVRYVGGFREDLLTVAKSGGDSEEKEEVEGEGDGEAADVDAQEAHIPDTSNYKDGNSTTNEDADVEMATELS